MMWLGRGWVCVWSLLDGRCGGCEGGREHGVVMSDGALIRCIMPGCAGDRRRGQSIVGGCGKSDGRRRRVGSVGAK